MASTRVLKSRIRSVSNTKQITKAMQMVAASKMRRAQENEKATAPYADSAREILTYLSSQGATDDHPLFKEREVKKRLIVVIAADKGLAGAYNSNVMKFYVQTLRENDHHAQDQTIAIGKRAAHFVTRIKETNVLGTYEDIADQPSGNELKSIVDTVINKFLSGDVDAVDVVYTKFVNSMVQTPVKQRILPAGFEASETVSQQVRDAEYEPSVEVVLDGIVHRLISSQVYQAILDAKASEWSMRMMAMKNATDNATDVIADLTLEMNKARQGAITQELAEISGGVEAMNN